MARTKKLYKYKLSAIKKLNLDLYHRLLDYGGKYKHELIYGPSGRRSERTKQTNIEKMVAKILKENNMEFEREKEILGYYFDIFLPKENILIEIQSSWWHDASGISENMMHIKARKNDLIKRAVASAKNIPLLAIWDKDISEEYIMQKINELKN